MVKGLDYVRNKSGEGRNRNPDSTLLLAYLSSYLVPFMVYMAQSTPIMNILLSKEIASAIAETVVGCTGLVAVAPLSALAAGILIVRKDSSVPR